MHRYPPPDLKELLLPVVACLPTAFFSPQPPPALLPLLSPILRQRVSLLSQSTSRSNNYDDNWLNLLTWSSIRAETLREIVGNLNLEPHPVSGELELFEDDPEQIDYRHLDAETVQAKCDVRKYGLSVVWTWCTNDSGAVGVEALTGSTPSSGGEDDWRVAEVRPMEGTESETWFPSQAEAEGDSTARIPTPSAGRPQINPRAPSIASIAESEGGDTDDDYWAQYDRTPSNRTPARSPAPRGPSSRSGAGGLKPLTTRTPGGPPSVAASAADEAESEYFARYGSEVQPALDGHDPEEEEGTEGLESTLRPQQPAGQGQLLQGQGQGQGLPTPPYEVDGATDADTVAAKAVEESIPPPPEMMSTTADAAQSIQDRINPPLTHTTTSTTAAAASAVHQRIHSPQPQHSPPRSQSPVAALESAAQTSSAAEVGVKQHISTEMKSLYRLARAAGIEREEFEEVVRRELGVLGLMEDY